MSTDNSYTVNFPDGTSTQVGSALAELMGELLINAHNIAAATARLSEVEKKVREEDHLAYDMHVVYARKAALQRAMSKQQLTLSGLWECCITDKKLLSLVQNVEALFK